MNQSTRLLLAGGGALALVVAIGAGILGRASDAGPAHRPAAIRSSRRPRPSASGSPRRRAGSSGFAIPIYRADQSVEPLTAAWTTCRRRRPRHSAAPEVAPDGRIWVASSIDNAFRILTPERKLAETWGSPGSGDGSVQLQSPTARAGRVTFAPGRRVLGRSTPGNFRVQRFDKDRKFLGAWGGSAPADGEFAIPNDISVERSGASSSPTSAGGTIQVFTSDGIYVRSVAAGHAGGFLSANGEGWVDHGSPARRSAAALTEYKPDGSIQGGIDMPDLMPSPLGMARDGRPTSIVVGLTARMTPEHVGSFRSTGGGIEGVWDAGGMAVAVSSGGDVGYVLDRHRPTTITKYVIPAP